ncbi:MAG: iron uptake porin [Nostoc sp. DedVER02]|uniref:iron uptake porin n=1 Tax=unclassified Nostoc TaxID=2593658 RepID=UPI002AD30794|nr:MULTISPECIES: iron uptake porin [unclassified Nostoc]MDZ7989307.1 iron uptake porin [Nostoc sp. DedVER02]MDZ8110883.1 iron uptake porin [Nostoc sp. DedVER01b]
MIKMFWKWLPISPVALGLFSVITTTTGAIALPSQTETVQKSAEQVTSVSQLSDVQPTDWAFGALQSLVERYGCIAGYPNATYRGNRALTRYEFAAGINACLERVNELIATATADIVKKEDLATLQKLQEQFAAELATLRGRVDALEPRLETLEQQQFSTTTKLHGEAIFALSGFASGQDADNGDIPRNTTFGDRVRLNFDTSFTGQDLLRVRLQALNLNYFSGEDGTETRLPEGTLAFNGEIGDEDPENNQVGIETLFYRFPLGKKTEVTFFANEGEVEDFVDTVNPFLDGDEGARGALSKFGSRNSVYYFVPDGAGVGLRHRFLDQLELSLGYLSSTASNPNANRGLFNGSYGAIAQLTFQPSDRFSIGLTYVNAYNNLGEDLAIPGTGSQKANLGLVTDSPTSTNAYGLEASYQVSSRFLINAWAGYAKTRVLGVGDADIWNYAVALAFPDLGKKGNLAGIIVGMEPKVTGADGAIANVFTEIIAPQNRDSAQDRNTSLHVEGFYSYALSDNITITPGLIWLTAPNHDDRNSDAVLGVIRTTFTF